MNYILLFICAWTFNPVLGFSIRKDFTTINDYRNLLAYVLNETKLIDNEIYSEVENLIGYADGSDENIRQLSDFLFTSVHNQPQAPFFDEINSELRELSCQDVEEELKLLFGISKHFLMKAIRNEEVIEMLKNLVTELGRAGSNNYEFISRIIDTLADNYEAQNHIFLMIDEFDEEIKTEVGEIAKYCRNQNEDLNLKQPQAENKAFEVDESQIEEPETATVINYADLERVFKNLNHSDNFEKELENLMHLLDAEFMENQEIYEKVPEDPETQWEMGKKIIEELAEEYLIHPEYIDVKLDQNEAEGLKIEDLVHEKEESTEKNDAKIENDVVMVIKIPELSQKYLEIPEEQANAFKDFQIQEKETAIPEDVQEFDEKTDEQLHSDLITDLESDQFETNLFDGIDFENFWTNLTDFFSKFLNLDLSAEEDIPENDEVLKNVDESFRDLTENPEVLDVEEEEGSSLQKYQDKQVLQKSKPKKAYNGAALRHDFVPENYINYKKRDDNRKLHDLQNEFQKLETLNHHEVGTLNDLSRIEIVSEKDEDTEFQNQEIAENQNRDLVETDETQEQFQKTPDRQNENLNLNDKTVKFGDSDKHFINKEEIFDKINELSQNLQVDTKISNKGAEKLEILQKQIEMINEFMIENEDLDQNVNEQETEAGTENENYDVPELTDLEVLEMDKDSQINAFVAPVINNYEKNAPGDATDENVKNVEQLEKQDSLFEDGAIPPFGEVPEQSDQTTVEEPKELEKIYTTVQKVPENYKSKYFRKAYLGAALRHDFVPDKHTNDAYDNKLMKKLHGESLAETFNQDDSENNFEGENLDDFVQDSPEAGESDLKIEADVEKEKVDVSAIEFEESDLKLFEPEDFDAQIIHSQHENEVDDQSIKETEFEYVDIIAKTHDGDRAKIKDLDGDLVEIYEVNVPDSDIITQKKRDILELAELVEESETEYEN